MHSARNRGFTPNKASGQTGFTLIEILVVFTVTSILASVGFASFVSYSRTQQVSQSANDMKLLINQARFNAISTVKTNRDSQGNTISCGNETLLGYSVRTVGGNQLRLSQECANMGSQTVRTVTAPTNISYTTGTNCATIRFSSFSANTTSGSCTLKLRGYGITKTITVDALGNASVQ